MTKRVFDTGYWTDGAIQPLSKDATFLYPYLWLNDHCNPAGLYEITLHTISFETKIPTQDLPILFKELDAKVKWLPEENIVWVKNFLNRQSKSPQFRIAAAKALGDIHNEVIIKEMIRYNQERYTLSIPYPYDKNRVAIGAISATATDLFCSDKKGGGEDNNEELSKIVTAYESNIGLVTPGIASRLLDVAATYPEGWFDKAMVEALRYEHRNLAYIERILERWSTEGIGGNRKRQEAAPPRTMVYRED